MCTHACDDALMQRVAGGDRAAFAEIVRRHRGWVVRVAARYLGSVASAEDVAQDTFLQLHSNSARYEARGRFLAYLRRIVVNRCHMEARASRRGRCIVRDGIYAEATADFSTAFDTSQQIQRAIAKLSEKHRETVLLRYVTELKLFEIAEALQVPLGTVKRRLFDSLIQLRAIVRTI